MKTKKQPKQRLTRLLLATLTALMFFGLSLGLKGQLAKTNSPVKEPTTDSRRATAAAGNKQQVGSTNSGSANVAVKPARLLSGAELYSMHCARCHPERYPNERTSAQWKTVAMHMRVRANLPAEHIRKLLKYLQDNSGY
jgi:hypothetical protein